jgi:hypothetical protein
MSVPRHLRRVVEVRRFDLKSVPSRSRWILYLPIPEAARNTCLFCHGFRSAPPKSHTHVAPK